MVADTRSPKGEPKLASMGKVSVVVKRQVAMNDKTLLPCPFCGGDAHIYTPPISIGDEITDVDWMRAQCTKCGTSRGFTRFRDHNRQSADFKRACSEAIAAWNTRAPQATRIEALEAALRRIKDATTNEIRAGDKGYVSRYGIHGIATKALEGSGNVDTRRSH